MHALYGNGKKGKNTNHTSHTHTPAKDFLAKVRYRFHNVHSIRDPTFRKVYLNQARSAADILLLAETNCDAHQNPRTYESAWAQDWQKGQCFWASAKGTYTPHSRGMALCIADNIPFTNATQLYPIQDQLNICGRILIVRAQLHHRDSNYWVPRRQLCPRLTPATTTSGQQSILTRCNTSGINYPPH